LLDDLGRRVRHEVLVREFRFALDEILAGLGFALGQPSELHVDIVDQARERRVNHMTVDELHRGWRQLSFIFDA
jgi:hypothetical protein